MLTEHYKSCQNDLTTDEYLHIKDDFQVMHGADRLFLPLLAMGCSGTVSGVSNVYPELFTAIYRAWQEKDILKARQLQTYANEACNLLKCGVNMSYFKFGLKHRGIPAGSMRTPHLDLTDEESNLLTNALIDAESRWPKDVLMQD